jgi:hypothetical protein
MPFDFNPNQATSKPRDLVHFSVKVSLFPGALTQALCVAFSGGNVIAQTSEFHSQ